MSAIAMETQIISNSQAASVETTRPFFSVRDVHAYYGESYIVQGVSLDIRKGEILALLGRNGAGKTSTLRTIARTDDPQMRQGEIWLDGNPVHEMKSYQAARAGIQPGDIILAVNDRHVKDIKELRNEAAKLKRGESAALLVERAGTQIFVPVRVG